MVKIKNAIEISFMSAFFAQFIYVHMTIYRNLTPNITKGQKGSKRVKKGSKIGKKIVKIKNTHSNIIYECNFQHDYRIYICAYDSLQKIDPKYNKRPKNGKKVSKIGKKMVKK